MNTQLVQSLSTSLQQRQVQEQRLSLQAQQRLNFLQMPVLMLSQTLNQKAEQNPFLEFELPPMAVSLNEVEDKLTREQDETQNADYFNTRYEGYGENSTPDQQAEALRLHEFQMNSLTLPETLYQHLEKQVQCVTEPGEKRALLLMICDLVDEHGRLTLSAHEILQMWFNSCRGITILKEADVQQAIRKLQTLDPVGIGARTLAECLEIQVRADVHYTTNRLIYLRLCHYCSHIVTDSKERLAKLIRCTPEELEEALAYLKTLNPFPGSEYARHEPIVSPEIVAVQEPSGRWKAICDERLFPLFKIDDKAIAQAKSSARTTSERQWIANHEAQARLVVEAYHERNETLRHVAQLIFDRQPEFLTNGGDAAYLKPLFQREIATEIGYDESTVSRTIKDKYVRVATSRKLLPLRAFFTHAVNVATGDTSAISDQQVKSAIRTLIAQEDPYHPLSDQQIQGALEAQKMTLARRTIAKYRDQLGILSTRQRRKTN